MVAKGWLADGREFLAWNSDSFAQVISWNIWGLLQNTDLQTEMPQNSKTWYHCIMSYYLTCLYIRIIYLCFPMSFSFLCSAMFVKLSFLLFCFCNCYWHYDLKSICVMARPLVKTPFETLITFILWTASNTHLSVQCTPSVSAPHSENKHVLLAHMYSSST